MKKLNLFLAFMLMLSLLAISVHAADPTCSLTLPASSTYYGGTQTFAISITSNGTAPNIVNVSGVNFSVSGVVVGSSISDGINLSTYSKSVDTSTITDTTSTTVTAYILVNGTGSTQRIGGSCTSTDVGFDNTNPTCSCTLDRNNVEAGAAIDYDCTSSSDVTSSLSYSCVMTYDDSTTETETTVTGSFTDSFVLGDASMVCTVTDQGSNSNVCSTETVNIQNNGDSDLAITVSQQESKSNAKIIIFLLIAVVAVVAIVITQIKKKKN